MNSRFFIKKPVEFDDICLIFPPSVEDIITEPYAMQFIKLLTLSQEEIADPLILEDKDYHQILTPLETLLNLSYNQPQFNLIIKQAFYFFTHEEILPLYEQKAIVIGLHTADKISNVRLITENNYLKFQNLIREACGYQPVEPFNFDAPLIKLRMDAKRRLRDQVKAKQNGLGFETLLTSICCMGMGINPLNIGELSYASISPLISQYQAQEKYHIDIDSILAGAKAEQVKPEYWIKNVEKE